MSVKQFSVGISTGIGVLFVELVAFATSTVVSVVENAVPNSASVSVSATMQLAFVVVDLLQNFGIGFGAPKDFAWGFLVGDLGMLVVAGPSLWATLPSVVVTMIVAFLIVLFALIIRITAEEGQRDTIELW